VKEKWSAAVLDTRKMTRPIEVVFDAAASMVRILLRPAHFLDIDVVTEAIDVLPIAVGVGLANFHDLAHVDGRARQIPALGKLPGVAVQGGIDARNQGRRRITVRHLLASDVSV